MSVKTKAALLECIPLNNAEKPIAIRVRVYAGTPLGDGSVAGQNIIVTQPLTIEEFCRAMNDYIGPNGVQIDMELA